MARIDMPEGKHPDLDPDEVLAYTIKHGQPDAIYLRKQVNPALPGRVVIATESRDGTLLDELGTLTLVDSLLDLLGVRSDKGKLAGARTELRHEITRLQVELRANDAARKFRDAVLSIDVVPGIDSTPRQWGDLTERERAAWISREAAAAELYRGVKP